MTDWYFLDALRRHPGIIHVQGHRGARGALPENTLQGFEYALATGIQSLELDVLVTRDDQIVVTHNPRLHPDTTRDHNGQWITTQEARIRQLSLSELQKFDVGSGRPGSAYLQRFNRQRALGRAIVPTLLDVFDLANRPAHKSVWLNIEVKSNPFRPEETAAVPDLVEQLCGSIRKYGLERRASVQSFDWNVCIETQIVAPEIATSYLTSVGPAGKDTGNNIYPGSPWMGSAAHASSEKPLPALIKETGGKIWAAYFGNLTKEDVEIARDLGLITYAWTVNDVAGFDRMIELGVDGIITDCPAEACAHLRSRDIEPFASEAKPEDTGVH